MSPTRVSRIALVVLALGAIAAGCTRVNTSDERVKTTSAAGESTAPSSDTLERRHEAMVRVVYALPTGANIDIYAGDLALFEDLSYQAVTPYRVLAGTRYVISVRPAGMANAPPLATNTEGLDNGGYYTIFVLPAPDGAVLLRVVDDHLTTPAAGKAKLRIVHASANAGEVDVVVGRSSQKIFDGVDFQSVTGYKEVLPFDGPLALRSSDRAAAAGNIANAHVEAGRFYTVVVVGNRGATFGMEAFVIEDAPIAVITQ